MNDISTIIYAANVSELKDEAMYKAAYHKVTDERRKKTDSLRLRKDRMLSLGAELLLLQGLKRFGLNLNEMIYHYGENGKPYLTGVHDVHFNLSHSDEIVICAISPWEIGCDVERLHDINVEIAKRFFCETEYDMINREKTAEKKQEMFFRLWTLKESFIKATGMGMSMPMKSFCINIGKDGISVKQDLNQKTYYFQEFNFLRDYKCSLCSETCESGIYKEIPFEILKLSHMLSDDCLLSEK